MLTRDSRIGEIYATPIGHDIIHTLLLQTGLPEKAVANPVVRRLSLRALQKLAPGRLDDSLVDSLLGLLNHETQTPPAPTGGITRNGGRRPWPTRSIPAALRTQTATAWAICGASAKSCPI